MSDSIDVVLVDDQALVRAGFALLINSTSDLRVVGEAENGQQGIRAVVDLRPDVVLMDIRMPILDGITAAKTICSSPRLADTKVLIVTTFDDDVNLAAALRVGVSGFIGKDTHPDQVLAAIRTLHAGDGLLVPDGIRKLIESDVRSASPAAQSTLATLTPREREVAKQVARGLSNEEIASVLHIGGATVKTHINRILYKTGARDRAQVVILAYESGLLPFGSES